MELYLHYNELPERLSQSDVVEALNRAMDSGGEVVGGTEHRIDMELEAERMNPKLAQGAVLACVRTLGFGRGTQLELGGMMIDIYG